MRSHKRLIGNIVALYILQGVNYIIPIAVLPFLVRVLGMEIYGLVAFSQSFAQYFNILTDYGFNLSATRSIAQKKEVPGAIAGIFWRVLIIKFVLLCIGLVLLILILIFVPRFRLQATYFLAAYAAVFGNMLFPAWYFQGTERMKHISVLTALPKLASAAVLFLLVRTSADGALAVVIQSCGLVVAGGLGFVTAVREVRFPSAWPTRSELRETLSEGWHLFVSNAAGSLYTNSFVVLVGLLAGNVQAGYFSAAEKIARGTQGLLGPVTQAFFPHISSLKVRSQEAMLRFVRKCLFLMGSASFLGSLALLVFAGPVSQLIFGARAEGSLPTLRWVSASPLILCLSSIFAIYTMIPLGLDRQLSRIYIAAGLISPAASVPLILRFGSEGAGISLIAIESLIVVAMWLVMSRNHINLLTLQVPGVDNLQSLPGIHADPQELLAIASSTTRDINRTRIIDNPCLSVCAIVITYKPTPRVTHNVDLIASQFPWVLVIDNGSAESSGVILRDLENLPNCTVLRNPTNLGIAAALNIGICSASAKGFGWVALFDQDSRVDSGFLDAMAKTYAQASQPERIAIIAPHYFDAESGTELPQEHAGPGMLRATMTSGSMMPLSVFSQCGLFDEQLFIDCVDIEFCLRVRSRNYTIIEAPNAVLLHSLGRLAWHHLLGLSFMTTNHPPARRYYIVRNKVWLSRKYWKKDFFWSVHNMYGAVRSTIEILLAEPDRVAKLYCALLGARDAIIGRLGYTVPL